MPVNSNKWGYAGSGYGEYINLEVNYYSYDIAGNYSTYGYHVWNDSSNSFGDTGNIDWNIQTINGVIRASGTRGNTPTTVYNQKVTYAQGTFILYHNADGSLPNQTFTLFINRSLGNIRSASVAVVVGNIPTIPRASSFASINSLTVPDHNSIGFNISSASSGFRHIVDVMIGSTVLTSASSLAGGANSITLTQAHKNKIIASMPNSTSLSMSLRMSTWSGSKQIGSTVSRAFTTSLGGSIVPSLDSLTHEEAVALVKNNFSVYVKNKSQVKVSVTRSAGQSATIKETNIYIGGIKYTGTTATSALLLIAGNITISAEVVDSRNRKATKVVTISVTDYTQPTISTLTAIRSNSSGQPVDESMIATVRLVYASASIANQNKTTFKLEYRKKGTANFALWTSNSGITGDRTYTSGSIFDINNTYEISLTVADVFQSVNRIVELSTAFTLVDYRHTGHGMAIGKVSERDALEIDLQTIFFKQPKYKSPITTVEEVLLDRALALDIIYPVGSIYMSAVNKSPQSLIGGTWVAFGAGRTLVGVDPNQTMFNAPEKVGGEYTHKLTLAESPSHVHSGSVGIGWGAGGSSATLRLDANGGLNKVAVALNSAGGDQPHNNIQPFVTVYMFKRTL